MAVGDRVGSTRVRLGADTRVGRLTRLAGRRTSFLAALPRHLFILTPCLRSARFGLVWYNLGWNLQPPASPSPFMFRKMVYRLPLP